MTEHYPRVLFVTSAAFNKVTGGGITFSNLFRGWPRDRLATVTNDAVPVSDEVCSNYFHLRGEVGRLGAARHAGSRSAPAAGPSVAPRRPGWQTRLKTMVFGNAFPDGGWLSPELDAFIADFKPDIIFTILGTIGMMELVEQIHRRSGARLVVHFMDDWPATLYRGGLVSVLARRRMEHLLRRLTAAASLRLGIGSHMCEAYSRRYGLSFQPFQNIVESGRIALPRPMLPAANPARVVYCGSIFSNAQSESLIEIAAAVAEVNRRGRPARLEIYSPPFLTAPFRARLSAFACVALHDTITDDDAFFSLIGAADLLLLPVNFDRESETFIRYSMPTKLPAYLASGTPVLGYGPPGVAQLAVLAEAGCGLVVGRQDSNQLAESLQRILDDPTLRASLSSAGIARARAHHAAARVRAAFQGTLCEIGR